MTLPDGWILRVSRSKGKVFYYNAHTKQTQWTRPTHEVAREAGETVVEPAIEEREREIETEETAGEKKRKREVDKPSGADLPPEVSERRAAIARCMRVGASNGNKAFVPWAHQVDSVDRMLQALETPADGPRANRFLLQHSTGSGKTVTIGALTHQLLYLEDPRGHRFHTIVLLIDRIKLDEQVGGSVEQFLRRNGVDAIHRASSIDHLASLLTSQAKSTTAAADAVHQRVIITTIQKIGLLAKNPVLLARLLHGAGSDGDHASVFSRIAIITDEAHRSHTAATRQAIEAVMKAGDSESDSRSNVTFVGFTATPNAEALQLFGSASSDDRATLRPFHCYSMSRAVADGRIVDVLRDYETVRCDVETSIPAELKSELRKWNAMRAVMDAASDDIDVLKAKSAYMMADFQKAKASWSRAKCMIVARSRRDVVRYYELVTAFVRNRQSPWRVFAVFSGAVTTDSTGDSPSRTVTEQSINAKHATLASSDVVIVCDKLDTGYSDPLLACMYIDRYLRSSVQTVQLLSRLNRKHPDKHGARIVDFANHVAHIRRHFANFWLEATSRVDGQDAMAEADQRTSVIVVCDAFSPWAVNLEKSTEVEHQARLLIDSLDRDAFQQLLDAVRMGASTYDRVESVKCGPLPFVRRRHVITIKSILERALEMDADASVDVDQVTQKMKTRVHRYAVLYCGFVDPMQLHASDGDVSANVAELISSTSDTNEPDDLFTYETLLKLARDPQAFQAKRDSASSKTQLSTVPRESHGERICRSRFRDLVAELAAFVHKRASHQPLLELAVIR